MILSLLLACNNVSLVSRDDEERGGRDSGIEVSEVEDDGSSAGSDDGNDADDAETEADDTADEPVEGTDADGDGMTVEEGDCDDADADLQVDCDMPDVDLTREVCVTRSTSAWELAYFDDGATDQLHWVGYDYDDEVAYVDDPILSGDAGDTGCVAIELSYESAGLCFNGYGWDSILWGNFLVGDFIDDVEFAYEDGDYAAEIKVTVDDNVNGSSDSDAEVADFDGFDLCL